MLVLLVHQTIKGPASPWQRLWSFGWSGVDLFFVLSGFLITGVLLEAKGSEGYFRRFYWRRALRVFPLYYAWLLLFMVVLPLTGWRLAGEFTTPHGRVWWWLFLSNWYVLWRDEFVGTVGVAWSLAIEEQFYLAWPAVVLALEPRRLLRWCLVLALGSFAFRVGLLLLTRDPALCYTGTFCRLDGLAAGAAVAVLTREGFDFAPWLPAWRAIGGTLAAGLVGLMLWRGTMAWESPWTLPAAHPMLVALWGVLLVLTVHGPESSPVRAALRLAPLRALGRYSYAIYLLHFPIQIALLHGLDLSRPLAGSVVPTYLVRHAVLTAAVFAAAWCSWRWFEGPILAYRERGPGRPRPSSPAAVESFRVA